MSSSSSSSSSSRASSPRPRPSTMTLHVVIPTASRTDAPSLLSVRRHETVEATRLRCATEILKVPASAAEHIRLTFRGKLISGNALKEKWRTVAKWSGRKMMQIVAATTSDPASSGVEGDHVSHKDDKEQGGEEANSSQQVEKLFVSLDTAAVRAATGPATNDNHAGTGFRAPSGGAGRGGGGGLGDMNLPPEQIDAMVDTLVSNPDMLEMIMQQSPELRAARRQNPDLERELRDPDFLRQIFRAQLDPHQRRQMHTSQQLQMQQLNFIPGGMQHLERMVHGMTQDAEALEAREQREQEEREEREARARRARTEGQQNDENGAPADDDADAGVAFSRPIVSSPMPNPWSSPPAHAPTQSSAAPNLNTAASMVPPHVASAPVASSTDASPVPPPASGTPAAQHQRTASSDEASSAVESKRQQALAVLVDMGFDEDTAALALDETKGSVDAAVVLLDEWQS